MSTFGTVKQRLAAAVRRSSGALRASRTDTGSSLTSAPIASDVTVIVPVYNVETYLDDCLQSLLRQSEAGVQIIIVDDGSTDTSGTIARAYAQANPDRVTYIHQENAGLGAARNAGFACVETDYFMFVDSDDELPSRAVETMLRTIKSTGSDFVCGAIQRVERGTKTTASWVRELHRAPDLRTTITRRPDMILDVFSTNKLYRTSFWSNSGLRFPEGVYYEDQIPSVKAYLAADAFDVITDVVYLWRIRSGDTSITQQTSDIRNLRDRTVVTTEVNNILLRHGDDVLRREWLDRRILSNDIGLYLKDVDWVSPEFYAQLVEWLSAIFREQDWVDESRAYPMKRLLAWAVVHRDREKVEKLREIERANSGGLATRSTSEGIEVVLDEPELG